MCERRQNLGLLMLFISVILLNALTAIGCRPSVFCSKDDDCHVDQTHRSWTSNAAAYHASQIRFVDQLTNGEVAATYRNGQQAGNAAIIESLGGGVAVLDFDGDSRDDLCFAGGGWLDVDQTIRGYSSSLFRNLGKWTFHPVTGPANLLVDGHYSHGVIAADYNSDGFTDFVITGYGGLTLWTNQGDGTFQDTTATSGLTDRLWSTSAGWGDLNRDGTLDLYVAHYVDWSFENHPRCFGPQKQEHEVCPPRSFSALPHVVYFGNGDGSFRDGTEWCGLRPDGKGLGVLVCDLDSDGDLDIYVANDTVENFLYENNGDGRLKDVSVKSATAFNEHGTPDGSMGVDLLDFNLDGRFDLWVTNYEDEDCALYENLGQLFFWHVSRRTGVSTIGGNHVSWGTCCFDIDCDGDEDIFVANGHVIRFPTRSPEYQCAFLCENLNGKSFVAVPDFQACDYLRTPQMARGTAVGDFDDDGRLDLAISHINAPAAILKNDSNSANHWLEVELTGVHSSRDAIGAIVRVTTPAGSCIRQWRGGGSYASTNTRRLHFGLGSARTIDAIEIRWPSGRRQFLESLPADQRIRVIESGP